MTTTEILARWPSATRDLLNYMERQGWIRPARLNRGKKMQGKNYPPVEVRKLEIMLDKREQGFTLQKAYEAACRELEQELINSRKRLLIVEDDSVCRRLLEKQLGDRYDIEFAPDAKRALSIANACRLQVALVLLSIRIPREIGSTPSIDEGFTLLRELQELGAPVFVMTTGIVSPLRDRLRHAGIDQDEHIFEKPFSLDVLGAFVDLAIAKSRPVSDEAPEDQKAALDVARR